MQIDHDRRGTATTGRADAADPGNTAPITGLKLAAVAAAALLAANCSSQQRIAGESKIDPKYGVRASPRVVAEGQPVPKGGGRELIGRPYKVAGQTYVPREDTRYSRVGLASWYGRAFHGRLTANGEVFDRFSISAAHPTMPLPSYARVTNLLNGNSMIVRVNDRGPYHHGRLIDVSQSVAEALEFRHLGTTRVRVDYMGRASLRGSDDRQLMATLRTDGRLASFPGQTAPVMVADAGRALPASGSTPSLGLLSALLETAGDGPAAARKAPAETRIAAAPNVAPRPAPAQRPTAGPAIHDGEPAIRIAGRIPVPPERPFDLGTVRSAKAPARPIVVSQATAHPQVPVRPASARLFFAPETDGLSRFVKADPFKDLKPQKFVLLKRDGGHGRD